MTTPLPEFQIKNERLEDRIVRVLRDAIISGALSPGERLIEESLAEKFGVSRAPLREALKELAAAGLVVIIPRKGTFVVELTERDIWEIYTLRIALETTAVEILAGTIEPEQIETLHTLIDEMRDALRGDERESIVELDMELHESLCQFCGHTRLYEAWRRIADQLLSFLAAADQLYDDSQIIERHLTLVDAIASGNRELAVETIHEHILNAADRLLHSDNVLIGDRKE